jgi:alkanesulfonate monooxygenase
MKECGSDEAPRFQVFSTCPPSTDAEPGAYLERVREVARWSEEAGCEGILVYTDNRLVDPWLVAAAIVQATDRLAPLVALQPASMHPHTAATMVATVAYLYGRRVHINLLAGGFKLDLEALGDTTPHDERYERATSYASIMQRLLRGDAPVFVDDAYYRLHGARLQPPVPPHLQPGWMISGSSPAGRASARALGAVAIAYPKPAVEEAPVGDHPSGIRLGLIARASRADAWAVARERFPATRAGQVMHGLATKASDSHWHQQLSEGDEGADESAGTYWLGPFRHYQTFCPYLVGSLDEVAADLAAYLRLGHRTLVLDIPRSPDDLAHTRRVLAMAAEAAST